MRLTGEVDSLVRAVAEAPHDLTELEMLVAAIGPDATFDDQSILEQLPNNYLENCREFCALAGRCKERAVAIGDPILLGKPRAEGVATTAYEDRA